MAMQMNVAVDEDAALLQFPKEFENAETLLISEVSDGDFYLFTNIKFHFDFRSICC